MFTNCKSTGDVQVGTEPRTIARNLARRWCQTPGSDEEVPGSSTSLLQELGQVSALPGASVVSSLCVANMGPTVTAIARIRCNWSAQNGAWLEPARDKHRMPFSRHHGHKQHHRYYDPASWLEDREGETAGFAETARPTAKPSAPQLPLSSPLLTWPIPPAQRKPE